MDAAAELFRLINGYRATQAIYVAARLGLADQLRGGPRTVAELAAATGSDPRSLYRLLRALATVGVFEEQADGRFGSTPLGDELRSDADHALADWVAFVGRPATWQTWGALEHSVRTGENAFKAVHGQDVWAYRADRPEESLAFDAAMTAMSRRVATGVLDAYDFGPFAVVADVGGGAGAMLAAVLVRYPALRGILFDQPHVVAGAPELLRRNGVEDRCDVVAGDLFAEVPGADAYLLKSILHDWADDRAVAIIETCRRAMRPGAVMLVLERVVPDPPHTPGAALAAYSDLNMLVGPGGQERSRAEYAELLARGGLSLTRIVPTSTDVSIVEAVAA